MAALLLLAACSPEANIDCSKVAPDIKRVTDFWTAKGVIQSTAARYQVNDAKWKDIDHDFKVSIALVAFCAAHPDGLGDTAVWGHQSGEILASVKDGNYWD